MLFRRFGRPGLLGLAAGTAVVAGTASAVNGAMAGRQQRVAQERAEVWNAEHPAPAPPTSPRPSSGADLMAELERLGQMHQQALLTDDEFAAAKQRLING
jgi:hypothetical protein